MKSYPGRSTDHRQETNSFLTVKFEQTEAIVSLGYMCLVTVLESPSPYMSMSRLLNYYFWRYRNESTNPVLTREASLLLRDGVLLPVNVYQSSNSVLGRLCNC